VTSFDDDLTPVVEEKETPESMEEVTATTTTTLQRQTSSGDDDRMDVRMSSSDSDPESHRHQGSNRAGKT